MQMFELCAPEEYCSGGELFDHIVAAGRVREAQATLTSQCFQKLCKLNGGRSRKSHRGGTPPYSHKNSLRSLSARLAREGIIFNMWSLHALCSAICLGKVAVQLMCMYGEAYW